MIDPRYIITLNGKDYPLYAGVLNAAHERGIAKISASLVQIPFEENGMVAICEATVEMKDGSVFSEIGDASPRNVNAKIASALIRMAATRAKGRALRDAVNIGQTLFEELPDLQGEPGLLAPEEDRRQADQPTRPAATGADDACAVCGASVTRGRAAYCQQNKVPITHPGCEGSR